jgi:hypothetical protein
MLSLAGALAAAALLAGCGSVNPARLEPVEHHGKGDGSTGSNGSAALSKPALIEQGDAICGEANAALASLDSGAAGNDPAVKASQELQITRSELDSLQALTSPRQEPSSLSDFLAALKDEIDALGREKAALDQGGDTGAAESDAGVAESNAEAAAQSYGFKECAGGGHRGATRATETTTTPAPSAPTTPTTPTTTPTTPTTPTPATPAAPATPPATGGAGGATSGGATGGGTGGGAGGTGGSGGVSP